MKVEIETEFGIIISERTVRLRLHKVGFKGRVARKQPHIDKANHAKTIQYAKTYRNKPLGFWDQVLWTDESKFNLFGSDSKLMVWRTPSEALDSKCSVPTVKHGGGNAKCWGCMSPSGLGNLVFIDENITGQVHRDIFTKKFIRFY